MAADYADQGLVVVALSREPLETVEPYIAQNGFTNVIVGVESTASSAYGVSGIPQTFIVGADGKVVWEGHPASISKAVLKEALKGAKKPAGGMLGVRTDFAVDARVAKAQKLANDGKLADALKDLGAIDADAKSTEQQKTDAKSIRDAIDRHLEKLTATAENLVKGREVSRALLVLETLSKDAAATDAGAKAKKRIEEIKADSKLMAEVEAAKQFERLKEQVKALATDKAKGKYDEFAKKYAGTKAGERAKAMARAPKQS